MGRRRVAVLISGRGSNLQALLDAAARPAFPAEIVLVLSNRPDAAGLARAEQAGVSTSVVDHRDFADRESFEHALNARLRAAAVDLVCLAGFMRVLTSWLVERWRDRMLNVHPSLLPAFPGLDTHARALAAGVRVTGCTVHFVRSEVDAGPIVVQAAVPVATNDSAERLAARVLEAEHRCYALALELVAGGRAHVVGERVEIDGDSKLPPPLIHPVA